MVKSTADDVLSDETKLNLPCDDMSDSSSELVFGRTDFTYENLSERFKSNARDFTKQFFHIYAERLSEMRDAVMSRVHQKWGPDVPIRKLIDLKEEKINKCVIIGTLFKHQELKPSILKEISEEQQLAPQPPRTHFADESDQLILEDEQQRIRLVGQLSVHSVVTGIVAAVLGRDTGDGKFEVDDFCWPGVLPKIKKPIADEISNKLIILISGIGLANNADILFPLQMFVDWMAGFLGNDEDQKLQSRVVRVIIAGNSVRDTPAHKVPTIRNSLKLDVEESVQATRQLDDFIQQLVSYIDVDLMPGEFDPSNHMLPQQPLHFCMFPKTNVYETLHGVTNPYECEVAGIRLLGTSGQPVTDIMSYSKLTDPLDVLQHTLEWGHLAPTCPDTLSGYPFYQEDPFIIRECPDVYFAGNQLEYQSKLYEGPDGQKTRLVCVPSFAKTHTCVVLDLASLDCYPVSFNVNENNI